MALYLAGAATAQHLTPVPPLIQTDVLPGPIARYP